MKLLISAAMLAATLGAAQAEPMNKTDDAKQSSPGATGAMQNSNANGVATDPGGVKAQQGDSAKDTSGTVGVAPTGDAKSQGKM